MPGGHRPLLRGDVTIHEDGDGVVLLRGDHRFAFSGGPPGAVAALVHGLNGTGDVPSVARAASLDEGTAGAVVDFLVERDLVVVVADDDPAWVDPLAFERVCRERFASWKRAVFDEPLWRCLADGTADRSTFLGWLLESYHFIQGVNDRLALAVVECTDVRLRDIFATHFVEEYDHARFFVDALAAAGVDREIVPLTRPLPATAALLNHMRWAARRSPLDYAVCSGFLESTGEDQRVALTFLDRVREHFAADRPDAIAPLAAHVRLDDEYGHPDNFARICALLGPLRVAEASGALATGQILADTLRLWATDIERSYGAGGLTPELRLDLHRYRPPPVPDPSRT